MIRATSLWRVVWDRTDESLKLGLVPQEMIRQGPLWKVLSDPKNHDVLNSKSISMIYHLAPATGAKKRGTHYDPYNDSSLFSVGSDGFLYRLTKVEVRAEAARLGLDATGYSDLSLLSLSVTDYTRIGTLAPVIFTHSTPSC
jgi:hypothetical protein